MTEDYSKIDSADEFLSFYPNWIASSQNNSFEGLNTFPHRFMSLGCTQALDEFHYWCQLKKYRIRMYRGEYPYSRDCIPFDWEQDFIEDRALSPGDAVLISLPFSGSGDVHPLWEELLLDCKKMEIPIFVDCAFFGTCGGIKVNFDHPNILFVAFSTTKGLSCGSYRSGILFSKVPGGHLSVQTKWHHGIHLNASIGLYLMKNYSPDFLFNKYRTAYIKTCEHFELSPTKCVHLALGNQEWGAFSRDGAFNRVGVRNAVKAQFKGELR